MVSVRSPDAQPVAIEDPYRTSSISSAALSPSGPEVALTTNITGSLNPWRVSAAGSWLVQLVNSDERQRDVSWSPDSRWNFEAMKRDDVSFPPQAVVDSRMGLNWPHFRKHWPIGTT